MTVNIHTFKQAMSQFASGVTVITTCYENNPIGITATAFSSLSLDPPLVIVNLSKKLFTHQVIADSGIFAVNILGASQQSLGLRFAGMLLDIGDDRFVGLQTQTSVTGCPLLEDALAWVDCHVWKIYDGGDHSIFVGEVKAVSVTNPAAPLLYYNHQWQLGLTVAPVSSSQDP